MGSAQTDVFTTNETFRLPDSATQILHSLARTWNHPIPESFQVIRLKGALTNQVFQIKWQKSNECDDGGVSKKVIVRLYGKGVGGVFFDREVEVKTFECMSRVGYGPKLLGRFENGRVEEFIRARTLSAADLRDPEISALIALKLREFNDLDMPGPKNVTVWDRLRNWLSTAKRLCPPVEATAFCLNNLDEEIALLEKELLGNSHHIGFCHNDLQYGNIMMDEETRSITLIDYEYAGYNHVVFDIANHFCEMTADYHTETPHVMDFKKYPGLEERQRFVGVYLSSSSDQLNDLKVKHMVQDVEKYTLASHLFWGLWGIISKHVNDIDFDYMEYARQRFDQYWLRKSALLGSS